MFLGGKFEHGGGGLGGEFEHGNTCFLAGNLSMGEGSLCAKFEHGNTCFLAGNLNMRGGGLCFLAGDEHVHVVSPWEHVGFSASWRGEVTKHSYTRFLNRFIHNHCGRGGHQAFIITVGVCVWCLKTVHTRLVQGLLNNAQCQCSLGETKPIAH